MENKSKQMDHFSDKAISLYHTARSFCVDHGIDILTEYRRLFLEDFHGDVQISGYTAAELVDDLAMIMYEIEDSKRKNDVEQVPGLDSTYGRFK